MELAATRLFFFSFFFFFRLSISRKSQRGFEKLSREQTLSADRKTEKNKGRFSYFFRQSSRGVIPACLTAKRPGYSRAGAFLRSRGAWGTNAGSKREKAAGVILRLVFRRSTLLAKRRRCFFFFFLYLSTSTALSLLHHHQNTPHRALYQLQLVPLSEAKKHIPPEFHIVSLFG